MSPRADILLLKLRQPGALLALLDPPGDANRTTLRQLAQAVIDFGDDRLEEVAGAAVQRIEVQRPYIVSAPYQETQLDTQTMKRVEVAGTSRRFADLLWLDIEATLRLDLVVEAAGSEIQSLTAAEIEGYASLDEFKSRFHYLDLAGFLAERGISTVEELRERARYLLTEIRLKPRPAFDAGDPASRLAVTVQLCAVVRDDFDIGAALRVLKGARLELAQSQSVRPELGFGTSRRRAASALAAIFPRAGLPGSGMTAAEIEGLFAAEDLITLFADP